MEGKINKIGHLEIKRGNDFKKQECPVDVMASRPEYDRGIDCSDCCPLFGEPFHGAIIEDNFGRVASISSRLEAHVIEGITLNICQGRTLIFDKFTDEMD